MNDAFFSPDQLTQLIEATGALGLASFALVDATKTLPNGGASELGFSHIAAAVERFLPTDSLNPSDADMATAILPTLHANWINGKPLTDQRAIAKSLIKLRLAPDTSARFAEATHVLPDLLAKVAAHMTDGSAIEPELMNAAGRFDLGLTSIIDAAYQRADQRYRNISRLLAGLISVALALIGGLMIVGVDDVRAFVTSIFCGVLAVPLAPIAKDLTSALSAGVKVAQAAKKS